MNDEQELIDRTVFLVDQMEITAGEEAAYQRTMPFMFDRLALIETLLPDVAARGLEVARRFHAGQATEQEIMNARVKCFHCLDANGKAHKGDGLDNSATQLVIWVLFPKASTYGPGNDLIEFVQTMTVFKDHSDEMWLLLRKHFLAKA